MSRKKIQLEDIIKAHPYMEYGALYSYVLQLLDKGELQPVKASGLNGKKPALYRAYWQKEAEAEYSELEEELRYQIHPRLDTSYYEKHLKRYNKDRAYIRKLSEYLTRQGKQASIPAAINERSFEIFQWEKYLEKEGGKTLLARLGLSEEDLYIYPTREPMAYYSHWKETPQKLLILENRDSFYSMRKHLIEGKDTIFGMPIGTLIYGGGTAVYKSFADYIQAVEPYFADKNNEVYYFGDLDYEGIGIYEALCKRYEDRLSIALFREAYQKMLEKAEKLGVLKLPVTKEGQRQSAGSRFFSQFTSEEQRKIEELLESRRYIPQEILNQGDY